ncbi:hypothetical protein BH11PAT4_BH11PAT4_1500 [soil metagenome]
MRMPWQIFVTTGVIFICVKLMLDLLVPIGVVLIVLGCIFYFTGTPGKTVKVLNKN